MALSIKNPEAEQLARTLAKLTGENLTDAIIAALRDRLKRERGRQTPGRLRDEILEIGRRCAALPDIDSRSPEEILGYDENGLFR